MQTEVSKTDQGLFLHLSQVYHWFSIFEGQLGLEENEKSLRANLTISRPCYGQLLLIQVLFKMSRPTVSTLI